jgi:hypothetical protein
MKLFIAPVAMTSNYFKLKRSFQAAFNVVGALQFI